MGVNVFVGVEVAVGSGVFVLIPLAFYVFTSRKDEPGHGQDEIGEADDGFAMKLLVGLPVTSVVIGAVIGFVKLRSATPIKEAAEAATGPAPFVAGELGAPAYVILAVALVVIFGGLVWCFWKALQAAGKRDPQMKMADRM